MVPLPCEAAADPPPAAATNITANKTALMSRSPRQGRDERRGQRREGAPRQRAVVVLPRMEAGPKIAEDATREQSHRAGERQSVLSGKSVSVRVDLGGRRIIKNKTNTQQYRNV